AFGLRVRGAMSEENIAARVRQYLALVGLEAAAEKMPAELSGGMRKRVALARAIATAPEIVLYDEPTTGLDPITTDAIADLIIRTREAIGGCDVTSVVVTHDMQVALKVADRIVMLHGGRIAAEGTPDYFRSLRQATKPDGYTPAERIIAQFVRGEADGPLTAASA
ncbi:MAG: ATP-binding cassette domain-containing protein, partial [Planctomycetota bacterium]|nr:ATP-binding cassette domain-containing protein [Planctomycetota bacterium]